MPKTHAQYVQYTPELIAELKALVKPLTRPEGVKVLGKKLGLSERQSRRVYAKYIEGGESLNKTGMGDAGNPLSMIAGSQDPQGGSMAELRKMFGNPKGRVLTVDGWGATAEWVPPRKIRRLYLDIESAPNIGLFWKSGWKLNIGPENILKERAIICIGWKWQGEKDAHIVAWDTNQDDKQLLMQISDVIRQADEIVYHNGDRFDLPWIRTRCLYHGLPPLPDVKGVDTLKWSRSKFYFNSNKLDYIAKFLGLGGKIKTEFGLWKDVVLNKCPKAMAKMCDYCRYDVILLEKVWARLAEIMPVKTHAAVLQGGEKWQDPRTGSTDVHLSKTIVSAAGVTKYQMKCRRTGTYHTISQTAFDAYLAAKKA